MKGIHGLLLLALLLACLAALAALPVIHAQAAPFRPARTSSAALPPRITVIRDVAYGSDPRQRFDVYAPVQASGEPVILLVHGGGWRIGDKAMANVVANKVARWVPRGIVVISVNYRMLPDLLPIAQARDVARALALAQHRAAEWGGDPKQFVLVGHSAGAHLVALLSTRPDLASAQHAAPWLGTVSLDSASLDVVQTMQGPHLPLFDQAFGTQLPEWLAVSPYQQMHGRIAPFLAVCSSRRFESCAAARAFVAKAQAFGGAAELLEQNLSHEQINQQLGLDSAYTAGVEAFLGSLSPSLARPLRPPSQENMDRKVP